MMLLSLALIILSGMILGEIFKKMHLPALLGMMLAGIVIGPCALNWIDPSVLDLSGVLRKIALLIILARAGLSVKISDLKKAGRPAFLLCFVPATFELIAYLFFAPLILGFSWNEAAILGTVMAAVSPAVVVPGMLKVIDKKYGQNHAIPQMILAGASADDIYVLVLFSVFCAIATSGSFQAQMLLRIPTSILLGMTGGILAGFVMMKCFALEALKESAAAKILIFLSFGMLAYALEDTLTGAIGFSGLIAVMSAAMVIAAKKKKQADELSAGFNHLWKAGEIFLFVLIGAAIQLDALSQSIFSYVLLIGLCLCIRCIGVWCALIGTPLNGKEKLFCIVSYLPKATVQAAIGAIPFSMGIAGGSDILGCAVTGILITAPLGAVLIHSLYSRLLEKAPAD